MSTKPSVGVLVPPATRKKCFLEDDWARLAERCLVRMREGDEWDLEEVVGVMRDVQSLGAGDRNPGKGVCRLFEACAR